jgi:hypothetical protein
MNVAQPQSPPEQRNAPVGMGAVALHKHEAEMQRMLDEALQALRRADPGNQRALATKQKSALVCQLQVSKVAESKVHVDHTNFATSEQVSFKRHRSALEKQLPARRRVTTTQGQKDFVPDSVMTPTKSPRHSEGEEVPWLLLSMCRRVLTVPHEQIQHDLHWPN